MEHVTVTISKEKIDEARQLGINRSEVFREAISQKIEIMKKAGAGRQAQTPTAAPETQGAA